MSTRGRIAIANKNGSFTSVYHHSDCYPEWLGKQLVENYTCKKQVDKLLSLGDISCLASNRDWQGNKYDQPIILTYRDRGETDIDAQSATDLAELFKQADNCGAEYLYIFRQGKWTGFTIPEGEHVDLSEYQVKPASLKQRMASAAKRNGIK